MKNKIPKIIHYCWFGRGEKPALAKRCIASWKKYCPDYKIIEWNEDNFDLNYNEYTRYCYDNKKYAFLSDFVRLIVISKYGGIYFDTDVELIKNPNELLQYGAFYGFENKSNIATGLGFGCEKNHKTVLAMIEQYKFNKATNGSFLMIKCPELNTMALIPMGLKLDGMRQSVGDAVILSSDYLNPYDDATGRISKTKNTISIHWYSKSWMSKGTILRSKLTRPFHRLFGVECFRRFRR